MLDEIKAVQASADLVFSQSAVSAAIDAMAQNINSQLAEANPLVLCVLNGGIIASGHLLPRLTMPLTLDSINASRYRNQTVGGDINWLVKPTTPLQGRTILVIDDILDEGLTLLAIKQYCLEQGAAAVYCRRCWQAQSVAEFWVCFPVGRMLAQGSTRQGSASLGY
jgi:hypoxanthine phosphoribosyltransferase